MVNENIKTKDIKGCYSPVVDMRGAIVESVDDSTKSVSKKKGRYVVH